MDTAGRFGAVGFCHTGKKRERASPLRLFLLASAASTLLDLASASTSLPSSSSSDFCPGETAACYDSPFCWDCVAQFADGPDACGADAGSSECDALAALYCCSFELSGQDCLGDAVTMDYFRCGLLEGSGCAMSDPPCSGTSSGSPTTPTSSSDAVPAPSSSTVAPLDASLRPTPYAPTTVPETTPSPVDPAGSPPTPASSSEGSQTPPPSTPPTTAPSTISPTETVYVVPSPVESDPIPSTPSPADIDRDILVTSGLAGVRHRHALGTMLLIGTSVSAAFSGW